MKQTEKGAGHAPRSFEQLCIWIDDCHLVGRPFGDCLTVIQEATLISAIHHIVGHADVDMTMHYLHVQDSIRQAAIDKFSEAFACEEEPKTFVELVKSS